MVTTVPHHYRTSPYSEIVDVSSEIVIGVYLYSVTNILKIIIIYYIVIEIMLVEAEYIESIVVPS
ncbi:unnamed protein product [Spodoptera exigua]|nr:unnamed protein product [Spodoptera exigua]